MKNLSVVLVMITVLCGYSSEVDLFAVDSTPSPDDRTEVQKLIDDLASWDVKIRVGDSARSVSQYFLISEISPLTALNKPPGQESRMNENLKNYHPVGGAPPPLLNKEGSLGASSDSLHSQDSIDSTDSADSTDSTDEESSRR